MIKDWLKPFINESSESSESSEVLAETQLEQQIVDFIGISLVMISQFHIFHWLTTSAQEHTVFGELYEGLQEKLDITVEQASVLFDIDELGFGKETSFQFEYADVNIIINDYEDTIENIINILTDVEHESLKQNFVEIQELIKLSKYKLTLE